MDNKNKSTMNESMFSAIDQIRQDSKDVRDFVKKVFADREFKKMSSDKEFIKYLKSIYEGTVLDEEQVKFSSRDSSGNITTTVREETINEGLKQNDMYTMLDIAAGYSSTQDQAANQMWSDEQDLYDYLKSDHIPKKYHKKFHNDVKRRFKKIKESVVNEMQVVNKKTGKDITKYVLALLSGKIDKKKFEKLTGLKKESVNESLELFVNTYKDGKSYIGYYDKRNDRPKFIPTPYGNTKDAIKVAKSLAKKNKGKYIDDFKVRTNYPDTYGKKGDIKESVPQGYNPMVEDKKQIKDLVKKVKHEKLFYDVLDTMEKKYGKNKYRIWLEKSLKSFGVNSKHYDYRTNAGAEEKLYQLGK